jgi:hypothetical protein
MKTTIHHHLKKSLKTASLLVGIAAFGLAVASAESENLITNPSFKSLSGKVTSWGQKIPGSLESFENPADSTQCGKVNLTYLDENISKYKGNIYQSLKTLSPGTYILSFSFSGDEISNIFVVVKFQEDTEINSETVLGKFEKFIMSRDLPEKGKWKDYAYSFTAPEGTEAGVVFFEMFGEADLSTGFALLKNVKLVMQKE